MTRFVLLLCCCLPALAQPLPLTWPQRPDGLVLGVTDAVTYDGAGVAGGPGEMIIARCDARDGDGRVVLQKISSQAPGGPGLWSTDLVDWGEVDGLFLPHLAGTPLTPWVVADGEGGAIAVWQDVIDGETSILRACRVGDGPGGGGAMLWPVPVTVSEDVSTEIDDCRDANNRCRSIEDDRIKAACTDDAGGAWIAWRTDQSELRLQHVQADGVLDPDLPMEGLLLGTWVHSFSLAADGLGNAVLCWLDAITWTLQIQGVHADGSLARPEGSYHLTLPENMTYSFRSVTVGEGRVLAVWFSYESGYYEIRAQLLDAQLAPQFGENLLVSPNASSGLLLSCAGPAGPVYLAWNILTGADPMAQRLGLDGSLEWGAGASLNLVEGATQVTVGAIAAVGDGLACLLGGGGSAGSSITLQRLDAQGQPVWSAEQALVAPVQDVWATAALVPDGSGGAIGAWRDWADGRTTLNVLHRDAQAQDLIPPEERTLASSRSGYPLNLRLLADCEPPLAFWSTGEEILLQTVDRAAGTPLLGAGGAALPHPMVQPEFSVCPDGRDGAWLVLLDRAQAGWSGLELQLAHVGAGGTVLDPGAPLAPGAADLPGLTAIRSPATSRGATRTFAAFTLDTGTHQLFVQALDDQGLRQWGDLGRLIREAGLSVDLRLVALEADDADGVFVLYGRTSAWNETGLYLQHLDAQGEPLFADNQGQGVLVDSQFHAIEDEARLIPLPDGRAALAWIVSWPSRSAHLELVNADGSLAWSEIASSVHCYAINLELTADSLLSLTYGEYLNENDFVRLRHFTMEGEELAAWSMQLEEFGVTDIIQRRGDTEGLVLTRDFGDPYSDAFGLQGLSAAGGGQLVVDYGGLPTVAPQPTNPAVLSCDSGGGIWYAWWDYRTGIAGYGGQLRLLRLDGMPISGAPAPVELGIAYLGNAVARLSWAAAANATSYDIYCASGMDSSYTLLANTTGTSHDVTIGGVRMMRFQVVSRDDNGD